MTRFRSALMGTALAAGLALGLGGEAKAATIFNVTSFVVTLGNGFDTVELTTNASKIDLNYNAQVPSATPWNFPLLSAGQVTSQTIGSFLIREECTPTNNTTCETTAGFSAIEVGQADLTVSVAVTFTLPVATTLTFNATVTPVLGLLRDTPINSDDLSIIFDAQTVAYGNGGSFTVDITDMVFNTCSVVGNQTSGPNIRRCGASLGTLATVELTAPELPIPEPAALAVLGMGLLGLAAVGRRRRID